MSALVKHLASYGEYHRDKRNVVTHIVGVPLIVLAVEILLSRPVLELPWFTFTPAVIATVLASIYYLKLDRRLGGALALFLILCARLGLEIALMDTAIWLTAGIGLFVAGWIIQFIGHYFEGRKPAFFDDLRSLLIGPLFVLAELAFMAGLRPELQAEVQKKLA